MVFKHFPHLTAVGLSYLAALLLFAFLGPDFFDTIVTPFGLIGVFIAGMLYTYSFTGSIGALILISIAHDFSPGVIAVVGGIGSLVSDITIFRLIRNDLKKEVDRIGKSKFVKAVGARPILREKWFRDAVGAIVLASPFPDEIGIAIMASTKIKEDTFTLVAFIADMVGIFLLVYGAQIVF
jgi:hypothetical protein